MIKILQVRDVKLPVRANKSDSGIDFFVPKNLDKVKVTPSEIYPNEFSIPEIDKDSEKYLIVEPWKGILIPAWIKTIIKEWYDLVFENKSWVSTKYWLVIGAKVVDSSYRWEVHLHLINTSNKNVKIALGQKIAQWILRKVENADPELITDEEFEKQSNTARGEWWFASSWER